MFTFSYDALGRRAGITRANSTSTAYVYDAADRLASLTQNLSGTANDLTLGFTYNADDQINVKTSSNDAYAYREAVAGSKGYVPNGLNQYGSVAGTTYGYDLNGNLTSDGATTYGYDVENRLISATGAHTATIVYDPLGRMLYTVGSTASLFLFDGDELIAEYNGSGVQVRRYVLGPGGDDPQVWYNSGGMTARRFLHADQQGSTIAVTDDTGLVGINSYDDYGKMSASAIGRYKYTGQLWVNEVGLYYYKARFYNPDIGRFMQTDPVGYDDQINLYAYVGNDPVNNQDPSGEACTGSILPGATCEDTGAAEIPGGAPEARATPKAKTSTSSATGNNANSGPKVRYHGHQVSDPRVRAELQALADKSGHDVDVTSGDRNFIPRGGATHSLHLKGKAADLHVSGLSDAAADALLHNSGNPELRGITVIQHGPFSGTEGPHIHLDSRLPVNAPTVFMHEGMTPGSGGVYVPDTQ